MTQFNDLSVTILASQRFVQPPSYFHFFFKNTFI